MTKILAKGWTAYNVNGKVMPVFKYVIKHYAMNAYGSGGLAPTFLTSALDGGELPASHPCVYM
jgi:hypothetical protein